MRSKIILLMCCLLVISCSKDAKYSSSVTDLGLNFSAKAMCSCLWVSDNTEEFCLEYAALKRVSPSITVDHSAKRVESSLFFFFKSEAKFVDSRIGCQLGVKN